MDKVERIIGLHVFTKEGERISIKDFINTPFVGYGIELLHDIGYRAIAIGESGECISGVCPIK